MFRKRACLQGVGLLCLAFAGVFLWAADQPSPQDKRDQAHKAVKDGNYKAAYDALRVLAIDPISFLILPRFIAITATLFMMTLFADAIALVGAAYTAQGLLKVDPQTFFNGLTGGIFNLSFADVANGLFKSFLFGLLIALASCYFGLATKGGAPGVGRAVNAQVVASAAGVFVIDYLVSFLLG